MKKRNEFKEMVLELLTLLLSVQIITIKIKASIHHMKQKEGGYLNAHKFMRPAALTADCQSNYFWFC